MNTFAKWSSAPIAARFSASTLALTLAGLSLAAMTGSAAAQRGFDDVTIKSTEVGDGVYMLEGAGGNLGLVTGADGAFLIDDQFAPLTEKITTAIAAVSDSPVEFVVNTHWHGDHTGGNENFGKSGAHIVAHENVRKRLATGLKVGERDTPPAPAEALPVITFGHEVTFHWNGRKIEARHFENAHTDGDAIIFIDDGAIIHMGDVFMNGFFAYIDLDSGGNIEGYIAAHAAVLAEAPDNAVIIPGHGPLATKADLQRTHDMLVTVRDRVQALIDEGKDEEATVAANPLKDLEKDWANGFMSADRMTRIAYNSLKK